MDYYKVFMFVIIQGILSLFIFAYLDYWKVSPFKIYAHKKE